MRKDNRYAKRLLVYLVIFIALLSIFLPLYFFVQGTINKEIERSNEYLINTLRVSMDAYIEDAEDILDELSNNRYLISIMDSHNINDVDINAVKHELEAICTEKFYVKDTYVLLGSHDCIISKEGTSGIRDYTEQKKKVDGEEYYSYRKALGKKYKNEFLKISDTGIGEGVLTLVSSLPTDSIGILKAQILVEIDICKIIDSMNFNSNYNIVIRDKNKVVIYDDDEIAEFVYTVDSNGIYGKKEKYNVHYTDESTNELEYIIAIKRNEYMRPLIYLRYMIFIVFIIYFILVYVSVKKFFNIQNDKILKILDLFDRDAKFEGSYEELYDKVNNMIIEKERIDTEIVSKIYLKKLLKGKLLPFESDNKYLDDRKEHGIILMIVEDCTNVYFNYYDMTELEKQQESEIITENIFSECLAEKYVVLSVDIDDSIVFVVEGKVVSENAIENIIESANEKIKNMFGFSAKYKVVKVDGNDYVKAYQLATNLVSQKFIEYYPTEISSSTDETKDIFCFYPADVEMKMISYITNGKYSDAKKELKEIIEVNFEGNILSEMSKELFYMAVTNTIVRVVLALDLMHHIELYQKITRISEIKEPKNFYDEFSLIIDDIEKYSADALETDVVFKKKISDYIKNNYSDANITLYSMGSYMQMNPSYFSRKFKSQFGMGVLEYIYKVRVDISKTYLDEDRSIEETAKAVGFTTDRAFVRAFKKYVGITPALYKKSQTNN